MTLDNFRTIELIWDKANKSIIKTIKTASSDTTGRYFSVKVLDEGQEVDLTGAKLQLYWEHHNFNTSGTDEFEIVNNGGLFKLTFSNEMLTNVGKLNAHLILTLSDGKITSDGFTIEVIKGADSGVVVPTNGSGLVEQIDGKIDKGNVTLGDLTQEVKLAMTGGSVAVVGENAVGTENIKNDAVTADKTSFFNTSSNLYDDETAVIGYALDDSTGQMVENASYITSDLIRVVPNTTYSTKRFNKVLYYDENGVYINRYNNLDGTGATFTTPTDAYYVRLQYSIGSTQNGKPQINRGGTLLPYDEFFQKIKNEYISVNENSLLDNSVTTNKVKDGSITPAKMSIFKSSANLFDNSKITELKAIDITSGELRDNHNTFVSDPITVIEGENYVISADSTRVVIYDENDNVINSLIKTDVGELAFEIPAGGSYFRVVANNRLLGKVMLNKGTTLLPFEEYHEPYIPDEYLAKTADVPETPTQSKPYYLAPNIPSGTIDPTDSVEALDGTGASGYNNLDISVADVYGWYDTLVSTYPNYVSREQIGTDASGQYPIYAYTFDANNMLEMPYTSTYKPKPKLILGTGMHGRNNMGDPNNSIYSLHWFMKDICEQNQSSEWFSYLRNNVTFKIIPLQNPWAVQNATRKNSNGVDINRNFDLPTWRSGEPTATDYGGTAPFSEPESRALRDYVMANDDAKLVMDFHTVGTLYEHGKWMYFEFPTGSELFHIANTHVKTMSSKWKTKNYPLDDSEYYGYVYNTLAGKYQEWVNTEMGIMSAVLEGAPHIPNTDEPRDSQNVMDMYYDSMSNWVAHFVKHL